jgi:hypothetical protein
MPKSKVKEVEKTKPIASIPPRRRNWASYFKEFFMLFLAIILGFFVENQRESYVEKKSADVLAQSMLEDLKQDKKALEEAILFAEEKDLEIQNFL